MFKKMTSNRPPDATLWTAFYKEFGKYIDGSIERTKRFLEARPRSIFFAMVVSIFVSIGCFLFLPKETPKKDPAHLSVQHPVMNGMDGIVTTVSALRELLEMRAILDTLMQKENLSSSDSLLMESAIDRMQIIEKRLAEPNKNHTSP